ncbi:chromatin-remodeling complex subunit ies6 [Tilletia horrida]|uniref:Chromatin-remodeling complex subunit ies6 n=1 Tax=Tilletia horrida TaxID=155126 RepID=A0AAN6GMN5_9BASI|nr:chromatin-remodeling complex subunit ies6 [Tilletia horrida]KAK0548413.1 chromatin-remodeling complex subunit ies6 [Tilletia horrida]
MVLVSLKWRPEPEGPPKPSSSTAAADGTPEAGPTLVEQLSYSSAPRPFKSSNFTKVMSKKNKTLKQIVTTEREAALGLITSGKRKGKKPTASEVAAMAGGGANVEAPFEMTFKGAGGRKMRLVGAAAKAAQARQLREQQRLADEAAGEGGADGDATMEDVEASPAGGPSRESASARETPVETADNAVDTSTTAETPTGATGAEPTTSTLPLPDTKPKRDVPSYFTVDAPPSLRPRKHYCDVTGLLGPYTDPKTRLRYHNAEIYTAIRRFGPGVDQQYLALRGDAQTIK